MVVGSRMPQARPLAIHVIRGSGCSTVIFSTKFNPSFDRYSVSKSPLEVPVRLDILGSPQNRRKSQVIGVGAFSPFGKTRTAGSEKRKARCKVRHSKKGRELIKISILSSSHFFFNDKLSSLKIWMFDTSDEIA